jgi:hypothetical protein
MAVSTQSDQIFLGIIAALAAKVLVVNLQIQPGSAILAAPAIPL